MLSLYTYDGQPVQSNYYTYDVVNTNYIYAPYLAPGTYILTFQQLRWDVNTV